MESDSGSDLGSDFGGSVVEHEVDSDGEIITKDQPKKTKREQTAGELEEKRKLKRMDKYDKKIKALEKKTKTPQAIKDRVKKTVPAEIRNKHKRQEVVVRTKQMATQDKKLASLKTNRLREELGEKEVPKGEVKTIESMRVKDNTIITEADALDEDFIGEKEIDEFAKYFSGKTTPKILLTTNRRPKGVSKRT